MQDHYVEDLIEQFGIKQIIAMFDLMPDVLFWVKSKQGNFIYANVNFVEHLGVKTLKQVVGFTDFDFSPEHMAKQFWVDAHNVLKGESVTKLLELNYTRSCEQA